MSYTLFDFLQLLGSLGIFIFGMKVFSDGLQKVAGNRLRSILKGMTTNRVSGIFTGFGATTITQSSTTTTVMVVSFVNAGLLTFIESTGVIMGANIGTTVTAWMVSIFGFQMQIQPIALVLIGLMFPFLFFGGDKMRHTAEAIIGFGVLFIGLEFIKESVPNIEENPEMFAFLDQFTEFGFASILIFIVVGTCLTLITQSSSAATAITLVMLFEGWINFPIAAAMILGENIGTTITANIAAVVGNVHAKRAARFHLVFNVVGVLWMLLIIDHFLVGVDHVMGYFTPDAPSVFAEDELGRAHATLGLSLFHSAFNIINVLLLFAFVPSMIRMVERFQQSKPESDQEFQLKYISGGMMNSAELSIAQAHKEIELFAKLIEKMHYSFYGLLFKKQNKEKQFLEKIAKREQITDNIELEVSEYLTQISGFNLSHSATKRIRGLHSIANDLERVGDLYYQMSKTFEQMQEEGLELPEGAKEDLYTMMNDVHEGIKLVRENMKQANGSVDLAKAVEIEERIDATRDRLKASHYSRLEEGAYTAKAGMIFMDFLGRLEKIGDHLLNVNEALAGKKLKEKRTFELQEGY